MGGIMMPYMGEIGQMGYVTPNTIPSLNLWYNASASATIVNGVSTLNFGSAVINGSTIGTWVDLSKLGKDANVQGGTGKQPTYAIPVQNNLGAVLYNATNSNNLDINPAAWSQSLTGLTIYVLARPTSLPSGTVFPLTVSDTNLGIWWNGTNWTVGQGAGSGTVTVTNDTTKFHIYGLVFDGNQTGNANRLQFRYDKSGKTLTFSGTVGANTGSPAYWFFGGDNRSSAVNATFASTYMNGYMGEVLIWTRALSSAELGAVELYLNTKWNLGLT
jgi:hypothetical protein